VRNKVTNEYLAVKYLHK